MRVVRSVVALVVAAGAVAGCGSAGQPLSDPDPGLLADATIASGGDCPGAGVLSTLLDSTGVAYDHQPTDGPRELALAVDAVVGGRLTGRFERVDGEAGPALDLGIDVQDLVLGEQLAGMTPPLSRLRVPVLVRGVPTQDRMFSDRSTMRSLVDEDGHAHRPSCPMPTPPSRRWRGWRWWLSSRPHPTATTSWAWSASPPPWKD